MKRQMAAAFTLEKIEKHRAGLSPDRYKILVHSVGKTYEEIGHRLALPRGTVKSRLHRARADLTKLLEIEALKARGGETNDGAAP